MTDNMVSIYTVRTVLTHTTYSLILCFTNAYKCSDTVCAHRDQCLMHSKLTFLQNEAIT